MLKILRVCQVIHRPADAAVGLRQSLQAGAGLRLDPERESHPSPAGWLGGVAIAAAAVGGGHGVTPNPASHPRYRSRLQQTRNHARSAAFLAARMDEYPDLSWLVAWRAISGRR